MYQDTDSNICEYFVNDPSDLNHIAYLNCSESPIPDVIDDQELNRELNEQLQVPIVKIIDNLYVGTGAHAKVQSEQFQELAIDNIINCSLKTYETDKNTITFAVRPFDSVSFVNNMDGFSSYLDTVLKEGNRVYVHSEESKSRAPALIIYYLINYHNLGYYQAIEYFISSHLEVEIDHDIESFLVNFTYGQ